MKEDKRRYIPGKWKLRNKHCEAGHTWKIFREWYLDPQARKSKLENELWGKQDAILCVKWIIHLGLGALPDREDIIWHAYSMSMPAFKSRLHFQFQLPTDVHAGRHRQWWWIKGLGPCHSTRRSGLISELLGSTCPNPRLLCTFRQWTSLCRFYLSECV